MNITDKVIFDETKILQEQTPEFNRWIFENCLSKINDKLIPDSLDEFDRPSKYTFLVDTFSVEISPIYINQSKSDWSKSTYKLTIKEV
jgi:hypothetical protein